MSLEIGRMSIRRGTDGNSVQMFIGEMGCWIVVLLSYVYRRFTASRRPAPLLAGGYRRVRNDDMDDTTSIEDEDQTLVDSDDPASKPLLATEDGRQYLRGWKVFYLAAPACCDITATTLMNVGLLLVAASIYQMTRGAVVLFVGLFSVLFLHRRLYLYKWLGLFLVMLGVGLVGLAGALFGDDQKHGLPDGDISAEESVAPDAVRAIIGVLLIAFAQIFTASQFVLEEWILERYAMDPLNVVGWEGIFGFLVTVTAQIILHLAIGRTEAGRYGYFDAIEGWRQVFTNGEVALASIFIMISIGYVFPILSFYYKSNLICQWLQLLRYIRHPRRLRHLPKHHRHLPYTLHLARLAGPRLGDIQMAPGRRLCDSRLRHIPLQRYRAAAPESMLT